MSNSDYSSDDAESFESQHSSVLQLLKYREYSKKIHLNLVNNLYFYYYINFNFKLILIVYFN